MLMLRAAEHSLDLPHCIWRNDLTGALLFDTLREAADRGVRVRLLPETAPDTLAALAERAARSLDSPGASNHVTALRASAFVAQLLTGELPLVWASTRMVSDPPAKVLPTRPPAAAWPRRLGKPPENCRSSRPILCPHKPACRHWRRCVSRACRSRC